MLWRPLAFTPQQKTDEQRHSNNYQNIARLKPGATHRSGAQQIDALNAAQPRKFPAAEAAADQRRLPHDGRSCCRTRWCATSRPTLYLMWGGALFVLLIGCVNVANLVLVRSRARLKELATRLALGAGTWRVARQLVDRERHPDAGLGGAGHRRRLRRAARCSARHQHPGAAARRTRSASTASSSPTPGDRCGRDRLRARPDSGRQRRCRRI